MASKSILPAPNSTISDRNLLGSYLKDRRAKLAPASLGLGTTRRRTPGLRREEVAQRADVSATWYTWLEQGRGGAPSTDVLDRVAAALCLTPAEREHLYLLALHRPPEICYSAPADVTPGLQRLLDSLEFSPAFVKTSAWDIVAWNRAAAAVLTDYAAIESGKRNILRLIFQDPCTRAKMPNWEDDARLAVATFRLEAIRAGTSPHTKALVEELSETSSAFASMWLENDVRSYGEGSKHVDHPVAGLLSLEYSAFPVDGQTDLGLVIYTPASEVDKDRVRSLLERER